MECNFTLYTEHLCHKPKNLYNASNININIWLGGPSIMVQPYKWQKSSQQNGDKPTHIGPTFIIYKKDNAKGFFISFPPPPPLSFVVSL